ncbi:MAG: G8 domain-containing protein [Opitutales bacterium]
MNHSAIAQHDSHDLICTCSGSEHTDDPPTAHSTLSDLVSCDIATNRSIQSGDWSVAETWSNGVPVDGDRVVIEAEHTVTLRSELTTRINTVRVDGMLEFATDTNTLLTVDTIVVDTCGTLTMGTEANPVSKDYAARIIIEDYAGSGINPYLNEDGTEPEDYDPFQIGLGLIAMGRVEMRGNFKEPGGTISVEPSKLDEHIDLDFKARGWEVGDLIAIAGTSRDALGDELRTITAIKNSKRRIVLDRPLELDHHTPNHAKDAISARGKELKVHVINLTRNVSIETKEEYRSAYPGTRVNGVLQFNRRGHIMFMHGQDVSLKYAGFYGLGRNNKAFDGEDTKVLEDGTLQVGGNPIGRYAVHFHQAGSMGEAARVESCALIGSPSWGYVNHSSHVDFYRNVAYDAKAASFVTEAGDEIGSFIENISIRNDIDEQYSSSGDLRFQKRKGKQEFAFGGHGFWLQGVNVVFQRNVASGAGREAMTIYPLPLDNRVLDRMPLTLLPEPERFGDTDDIGMGRVSAHTFEDNVAYGSNIGIMVGEHRPFFPSEVKRFLGWSIKMGLSSNYSSNISYQDITLIGDLDKPMGVAAFAHHGTSNVEFINPYVEGFAIGIQVPRAGNDQETGGKIMPGVPFNYGLVEDGYFNNIINLHFPFVRHHTSLLVDIVQPTFGVIDDVSLVEDDSYPDSDGALLTPLDIGLRNLGRVDNDGDFNIDSSSKTSNGFGFFEQGVASGEVDRTYNYFFHYAAGPEISGEASKHKRNFVHPTIFMLDLGEAGEYQLFFEDIQSQDHVPYPAALYEGRTFDNGTPPVEFYDKTNAELALMYQLAQPDDPDGLLADFKEFFSPSHYWKFSNLAFAQAGSMLPRDYLNSDRFTVMEDAYKMVAMRIDDLPEYRNYLSKPEATLMDFNFDLEFDPLRPRLDKPAARWLWGVEGDLIADGSGNNRLYLNGQGQGIDYEQPFHLAFKTYTLLVDVCPLEVAQGVFYEWANDESAFQLSLQNGALRATLKNASGSIVEINGGQLNPGFWHQVALAYNLSLGKVFLYLDGELLGHADLDYITSLDLGDVRVGRGMGHFVEVSPYRGFIDNIRFLEKTFTVPDMADYYVRTAPSSVDETLSEPTQMSPLQDSDSDWVPDIYDAFPDDATEWADTDTDGEGDNTDPDIDNDTYVNAVDGLPYDDSDHIDSDGDGFGDLVDVFINDPFEWADLDGDGYGDNIDKLDRSIAEYQDSDDDGWGDKLDKYPLSPYLSQEPNLLENFGAEDDLLNWTADVGNTTVSSEVAAYSGDRGFYIEKSPSYGTAVLTSNSFPIIFDEPIYAVNISAWVRVKYDDIKDGKVQFIADIEGVKHVNRGIPQNIPREWTYYSFDFVAKDGGIEAIHSFKIEVQESSLPVYFDDIHIAVARATPNADGDDIPDLIDRDDDNDGYLDGEDAFVTNSAEWLDSDGDGEGNNGDPDDDNDGLKDLAELEVGLDPLDALDAYRDFDGDGQINRIEVLAGTDIRDFASKFRVTEVRSRLDGSVDIRWAGGSEKSFYLEYSDDMAAWSVLPGASDLSVLDGFIDTPPLNVESRFYRVGVNE